MHNKYLYLFQKDASLRALCFVSVIGLLLCLVFMRLDLIQRSAFKDIQDKEALIAQIPEMQNKIIIPKVFVQGLSLTLNGVIEDKGQTVAVINDTFLKVGGKIDGKVLTSITPKSAMLCDVGSTDKCVKLMLY